MKSYEKKQPTHQGRLLFCIHFSIIINFSRIRGMSGIQHGQGLLLAAGAGIMAALGSVSAKLATNDHFVLESCQFTITADLCVQVRETLILILSGSFYYSLFCCYMYIKNYIGYSTKTTYYVKGFYHIIVLTI